MINIIGAGLAGCEAAYQLAKKGFKVNLYEMKKVKKTPAQKLETFAELVCSNSLRSDSIESAVGILKEELRILDSLIMKCAEKNRLPSGSSLGVDREKFSQDITDEIMKQENITVIDGEVTEIDWSKPTIIASGPLTSEALSKHILEEIGQEYLYFFDAAAPIVDATTINFDKAFYKSRWDDDSEDTGDYINCPMTKEEYQKFYDYLISADCAEIKEFEMKVFEGCMPVEEMASRGPKTLLFGPMKPVGLMYKGERHYAVVQLRQDNAAKTLFNIVGFQTHLTWPAQDKLLKFIPGLENAKIVRYGVMHKNVFINAPTLLNKYNQYIKKPNVFFAGQITGVEGYVESTGSGMVSAINMIQYLNNQEMVEFGPETAHGALLNYITTTSPQNFQPMNVTFGLFAPLGEHNKQDRKRLYSERAIAKVKEIKAKLTK